MSIPKRTVTSPTTCLDHSCSVLSSPVMPVHIFKFVPQNAYVCSVNKGLMQGPVQWYAHKTSYSGLFILWLQIVLVKG